MNAAMAGLDPGAPAATPARRRELSFSRTLKPAVIAPGDPLNVATWSGTPLHMVMALQTHYPDLLPVRAPVPGWVRPVRRVARRLTSGRIDIVWNRMLAENHAKRLAARLHAQHVDVALCIASSPLCAALATRIPSIHISDATAAVMVDFYPEFTSLSRSVAKRAVELDRDAVLRSKACLFPNEWAAQSAIRDYGADPALMHVIPFGGNVDPDADLFQPVPLEPESCNLVFVGVDWQRKGGDIAVAAVHQLRDRGIAATLDIMGARPALSGRTDGITVHGFLDKSTPEGAGQFNALLRRATFLLVPTRQECFGMFAPEANAFGVPVISTRTGGLPGTITDGVNGYLLPRTATPGDYADVIAAVWANRAAYLALRASSFRQVKMLLNWRRWGMSAAAVIDRVMR